MICVIRANKFIVYACILTTYCVALVHTTIDIDAKL